MRPFPPPPGSSSFRSSVLFVCMIDACMHANIPRASLSVYRTRQMNSQQASAASIRGWLSDQLQQLYSPTCTPQTKSQIETQLQQLKQQYQTWQGCYSLLATGGTTLQDGYVDFYTLTMLHDLVQISFLSSLSPQDRHQLFAFLCDQKYFQRIESLPVFVANKLCAVMATMVKLDPMTVLQHSQSQPPQGQNSYHHALYALFRNYIASERGEVAAAALRLLHIVVEECTSSRKASGIQVSSSSSQSQQTRQEQDQHVSSQIEKRASKLVYTSMEQLVTLLHDCLTYALQVRYKRNHERSANTSERQAPTMLKDIPDDATLNKRILVLSLMCLREMITQSPPSMDFPENLPATLLSIMQNSLQSGSLPAEGIHAELFEHTIGCVTELCRKRNWREKTQAVVLQCIENVTSLLNQISNLPSDQLISISDTVLRECLELLQSFLENHISRLEQLSPESCRAFVQVLNNITRSTHLMYHEEPGEISTHMHSLQIWRAVVEYVLDCQERRKESSLCTVLVQALHDMAPWILSNALFSEHDSSFLDSSTGNADALMLSCIHGAQSASVIYADIPGFDALQGLVNGGKNRRTSQRQMNSWIADAEWELYGAVSESRFATSTLSPSQSSWDVLPGFIDRGENTLHSLVKEALEILLRVSNLPSLSPWLLEKLAPFLQSCFSTLQQGALLAHNGSNEALLMDFSTVSILATGILTRGVQDESQPQLKSELVSMISSVIVNSLNAVMAVRREEGSYLLPHVQVSSCLSSRSLLSFLDMQYMLVSNGISDYFNEANIFSTVREIIKSVNRALFMETNETQTPETVQAAAVSLWAQMSRCSPLLRKCVMNCDEFANTVSSVSQYLTSQTDAHTLLKGLLCRMLLDELNNEAADQTTSNTYVGHFEKLTGSALRVLQDLSTASQQQIVTKIREDNGLFISLRKGISFLSCVCRAIASESIGAVRHWYKLLSSVEPAVASFFHIIISNPDTFMTGARGVNGSQYLATIPPKNVILATTILQHFYVLYDSAPSTVSSDLVCSILVNVSNSLVGAIQGGILHLMDQQGRSSPSTARLLLYFLRFLRASFNVRLSVSQMNSTIPTILTFCLNEIGSLTEPSQASDGAIPEMSPVLHHLLRTITWNCTQFFCRKEIQQSNSEGNVRKTSSWRNEKSKEAFHSILNAQVTNFSSDTSPAELVKFHLETWRGLHQRLGLFSEDLFEHVAYTVLQSCCKVLLNETQIIVEEDIIHFLFEVLQSRDAQRVFFSLSPTAVSKMGGREIKNQNFTLATALSLTDSPMLEKLQHAIEVPSENDIHGFELSLRKCLEDIRSTAP